MRNAKWRKLFLHLVTSLSVLFLLGSISVHAQRFVIRVSAGVGDPWWQAVKETYEAINPDVEIRLESLQPPPEGHRQIMLQFIAGNPWDVFTVSEAYLMAAGGEANMPDIPYIVDLEPYLTPEERKDFGEHALLATRYIGKYQGLPFGSVTGNMVYAANRKLLEEAGIDWRSIQKNGWEWPEFIDALIKLTNPSENRWGTAISRHDAQLIWPMYHALNNGVPFTHVTWPMYDNKFKWYGQEILEVMELMHDLIYKYKVVPPGVVGMETSQVEQMLFDGRVAMMIGWIPAIYQLVDQWNAEIAANVRVGTPSDVELVPLPIPTGVGKPERVLPRSNTLWVMIQEPYKGDEHLEQVIRFVKFLSSPLVTASYVSQGQIPVRASTLQVRPELALDERVQFIYDYFARAGIPWAPRHPAYTAVQEGSDAPLYEMFGAVYYGQMTPREAYERYIPRAKAEFERWVKSNPEDARMWAETIRPTEETAFIAEWEPTPVPGVDD